MFSEDLIKYVLSLKNCNTMCKKKGNKNYIYIKKEMVKCQVGYDTGFKSTEKKKKLLE